MLSSSPTSQIICISISLFCTTCCAAANTTRCDAVKTLHANLGCCNEQQSQNRSWCASPPRVNVYDAANPEFHLVPITSEWYHQSPNSSSGMMSMRAILMKNENGGMRVFMYGGHDVHANGTVVIHSLSPRHPPFMLHPVNQTPSNTTSGNSRRSDEIAHADKADSAVCTPKDVTTATKGSGELGGGVVIGCAVVTIWAALDRHMDNEKIEQTLQDLKTMAQGGVRYVAYDGGSMTIPSDVPNLSTLRTIVRPTREDIYNDLVAATRNNGNPPSRFGSAYGDPEYADRTRRILYVSDKTGTEWQNLAIYWQKGPPVMYVEQKQEVSTSMWVTNLYGGPNQLTRDTEGTKTVLTNMYMIVTPHNVLPELPNDGYWPERPSLYTYDYFVGTQVGTLQYTLDWKNISCRHTPPDPILPGYPWYFPRVTITGAYNSIVWQLEPREWTMGFDVAWIEFVGGDAPTTIDECPSFTINFYAKGSGNRIESPLAFNVHEPVFPHFPTVLATMPPTPAPTPPYVCPGCTYSWAESSANMYGANPPMWPLPVMPSDPDLGWGYGGGGVFGGLEEAELRTQYSKWTLIAPGAEVGQRRRREWGGMTCGPETPPAVDHLVVPWPSRPPGSGWVSGSGISFDEYYSTYCCRAYNSPLSIAEAYAHILGKYQPHEIGPGRNVTYVQFISAQPEPYWFVYFYRDLRDGEVAPSGLSSPPAPYLPEPVPGAGGPLFPTLCDDTSSPKVYSLTAQPATSRL